MQDRSAPLVHKRCLGNLHSLSTPDRASEGRSVFRAKCPPLRSIRAACALALHRWLCNGGSLQRLDTCQAEACVDIFLDDPQASTRRYCSASCGNRTKAAAHRSRIRWHAAVAGSDELAIVLRPLDSRARVAPAILNRRRHNPFAVVLCAPVTLTFTISLAPWPNERYRMCCG
jgi:CGNR zinc finger